MNKFRNNNKPFTIEGKEYRTLKEASEILNIPVKTIHDRLSSNNPLYREYKYVKPKSTIERPKW